MIKRVALGFLLLCRFLDRFQQIAVFGDKTLFQNVCG